MQITILEGSRGTGKSTLAFKLRQKIPETTLINFTGFHLDGQDGLNKVTEYYHNWMQFLVNMTNHDSKFVFDRFYFSESVFSLHYKDYSFSEVYEELNKTLSCLSRYVKINIVFLTIDDEEELKMRLMRDKVPFGKAEESVISSNMQQETYRHLFASLKTVYGSDNFNIHTIDTSGKTSDEVYDEILQLEIT